MSGSYVNGAAVAVGSGSIGRHHRPPPTQPRTAHALHGGDTTTLTSTSLTSVSPSVVIRPQRIHLTPQRSRPHQAPSTAGRTRSVFSQRLSQVYEMASEARPTCLHRAAVSPALWLLCQTVLVVLFAICCTFLISGSAVQQHQRQPLSPLQHGRALIRLVFDKGIVGTVYNQGTEEQYYRRLIRTEHNAEYFKVHDGQNGSFIEILMAGVYRINAAVTFRVEKKTSFTTVDTSVYVRRGNAEPEPWISCQQGVAPNLNSKVYAYCTLYGIRYLERNYQLSFKSSYDPTPIVTASGSTFFEVEVR